ncbi:MAG TPA: sigma-54 dependent transcriptional regulator [Terriglobia bacterium]|nr:sigma-54 dependent transcriptional regulator [Terriglobia bacterium]
MKEREITLVAIDDDALTLELIEEALAGLNLQIFTYSEPEKGLNAILEKQPDIAALDLVLPGHDGMQLLEEIVEHSPMTEVLLMTGHYSTDSALEAIQKGACDYLTKPISVPDFRLRISRLAAEARRRREVSKLEKEVLSTNRFEGMVGQSPLMRDLFNNIRRIAPHFRTALITGATGTGKELVARALHRLSPASNGRFVDFNCSAVVETLFESELFGYVKGAFTGAAGDRMGLFEHASNGVLFLDELGDTPLSMQSKLLRALQNQEIRRVGSPTVHKVNVRVIAATNRDLPRMISEGKFRDDLYFRLSMVELKVPRLADRKEDIPLLVPHFIEYFNEQYNKNIRGLTPRAQAALSRYSWPGNVRELENVLGAACMMCLDSIIDIHDLRDSISNPQSLPATEEGDSITPLADIERRHARSTLKRMRGNKVKTAEALRISRGTLYRLLEEEEEEENSQAKTG